MDLYGCNSTKISSFKFVRCSLHCVFPHIVSPLNSFRTFIYCDLWPYLLSPLYFQTKKKNSFHGNYMRKYGNCIKQKNREVACNWDKLKPFCAFRYFFTNRFPPFGRKLILVKTQEDEKRNSTQETFSPYCLVAPSCALVDAFLSHFSTNA